MSRDLWIFCKSHYITQADLNYQVNLLNTLVYDMEKWSHFCRAHEIIDLNRHKIIHKPHLIQAFIQDRKQKPFVFVNNLN